MSFKLSIVAPSGKIFEDTVSSLAVPGIEGAFEVYSEHMPLISVLKPGKVRVRKGGHVTAYEITDGILEVTPQHDVLLLADQATAISL